ncbi:hypothetical protein NN561_019946 [Cricetulus griseus]
MSGATIVHDTSEAVALCPALGLYLKPITKVTISVALPPLRQPGKSISNWEVMERLKAMAAAQARAQFSALRIAKSTLDFIRFEAEVENRALVRPFLACLDGKTIKLSGFADALRVRAAEKSHPCSPHALTTVLFLVTSVTPMTSSVDTEAVGIDNFRYLRGSSALRVHDLRLRAGRPPLSLSIMSLYSEAEGGSALLLVEAVLSPGGRGPLPALLTSLTMLAQAAGREREEAEFRALTAAAGFPDLTLRRPGGPFAVMLARK